VPYCFGVFEFDAEAGVLRKSGVRLKLGGQPGRVLALLVSRPGDLVSRAEIREALWDRSTFTDFDHGVDTAVERIRRTLGDSARNPTFIETLPRRGYRFIAPVQEEKARPSGPATVPATRSEDRSSRSLKLVVIATAALLATVALAAWMRTSPERGTASISVPEPLTYFPGRELYPTFSPDGSQVAFSWEGPARNNWDIYVKGVDGETVDRLTTHHAEDFDPVWSPDGQRIAFFRKFDQEETALMAVPSTGGPARRILTFPSSQSLRVSYTDRNLTWHANGRRIFATIPKEKNGLTFLQSIDAETGEAQPFLPDEWSRGARDPAVTQDGRKLAMRRGGNATPGIFITDLGPDGEAVGEPRQLETDQAGTSLAWSADDTEVLFGTRFAERVTLFSAPAQGGKSRALTSPSRLSHPSVAGTGRLAFASWLIDFDTWELELNRGRSTNLISSTFFDVTPQYSPDGTRIAFSSARTGYREIWLSNRDGSGQAQLTDMRLGRTSAPYWSPDGSWIVFQCAHDGQIDVYAIRASGGEARRITDAPGNDVQPTISRDGRWIYFGSARGGRYSIWKTPPEGGEPVQVTEGNTDRYALESPDGRALYISDGRSLWKMPVEGGPRELVIEQFTTSMDWAVGEFGIYFKNRFDSQTIDFYDFESQELSSIVKLAKPSYTGLSLSPDGKRILFVQGELPESDIMLSRSLAEPMPSSSHEKTRDRNAW